MLDKKSRTQPDMKMFLSIKQGLAKGAFVCFCVCVYMCKYPVYPLYGCLNKKDNTTQVLLFVLV